MLLHVSENTVTRIFDIIKESSPGGDIINAASKRIYIGPAVEFDWIKHLIRSDVPGCSCYELSRGVSRDSHGSDHTKVNDGSVERTRSAGIAMFERVKRLSLVQR